MAPAPTPDKTAALTGGRDAVAVVTGGGVNIGRAVALHLAATGARVVVTARRRGPLDETAAAIAAGGGTALALPADVTDPAALEEVVAETSARFGRIDILVAAAGGSGAHEPVDTVAPAAWHDVVARNLFGTFHAARAVLPAMRAQGRGVIVTFAGGGAFFPELGVANTAYACAKAAVCRFTDQLQAELLDTAIRVHCVDPGLVWSPERRRAIEAEEARTGAPHPQRAANRPPEAAAELVGFLASEAAAALRGRVVSVHDTWWRDPDAVRRVEAAVHLYRLRRVEEAS